MSETLKKQCLFCFADILYTPGASLARFKQKLYCNRKCAAKLFKKREQAGSAKTRPNPKAQKSFGQDHSDKRNYTDVSRPTKQEAILVAFDKTRTCSICGQLMAARHYEGRKAYAVRKYCGKECLRVAQKTGKVNTLNRLRE